jgi:phosphatidylethanolamine/phosphatidyl-N-methylethanolamine N-methyltransferase
MDSSEAGQVYPAQFGQFFRSWMQDPLAIGAVAPSGRTLAKLMVSGLYAGARVMELGSGTGTVTRAILDCGVAQSDLYLVERNESFARLLRQRFPHAALLQEDATSLSDATRSLAGSFDFIVSGLPLVLFSRAQKQRLIERAFELLKTAGAFHQFTYGLRCPIRRAALASLKLDSALIGIAPFNVPPAFVYRLHRGA